MNTAADGMEISYNAKNAYTTRAMQKTETRTAENATIHPTIAIAAYHVGPESSISSSSKKQNVLMMNMLTEYIHSAT